MPSAALLRKTLLSILQEKIIPELSGGSSPRIVLAHLPLDVPAGIAVRELPYPPLRDADAKRIYPEGKEWDSVQMHAICFPHLLYVAEGEADLPMGVTTAMLSRLAQRDKPQTSCGGYLFALPASTYFLVPPGVPQRTGDALPWRRDEPHTGTLRFFQVGVLPVGALCHFSTMRDETYKVEYSLLVKDNQLTALMGVLMDELSTPPRNPQVAQSLLLALMLRLHGRMSLRPPMMTDGLYSRFPDSDPFDSQAHPIPNSVAEKAHEFIRLRLHESLTPAAIAEHVRLTPTQLNRILKANAGMSTMNYVARLRMESAQLLLRTSTLSVQEISRLVGYKQLSHFSSAFQRHVGQSPLKFRQHSGGDS